MSRFSYNYWTSGQKVDDFCQEFEPEEAEIDDPTVEEETAFKESQMIGEGEEEEEEEEYDD